MADLRPLSPLADRPAVTSPQVTLSVLPEGTILQVIAGPNAPDQAPGLERLATEAGLALRTTAPGQWLLVGDKPMSHSDMCRLLATLEPHASGIDQSHGRVRMLLEGPMGAGILSKGTAVDIHPSAFPVGRTVATLIGHVSAHITCVAPQSFEVSLLRSFAETLWDDFTLMCAEYLQAEQEDGHQPQGVRFR